MAVCYLEVDDEITTAIARIRAVTDGEAVIVVPPGSRIASSRINFKLLAREANERRLNVVTVSDEPAVRALAISAGLPSYDSLAGAEQALANFREQDRRLAERIGRAADELPPAPRPKDGATTPPAATYVLPSPVIEAPAVEGRRITDTRIMPVAETASGEPSAPVAASSSRARRRRNLPVAPLLVVGLLALFAGGVAYGAYLFLPTASITLRPTTSAFSLPAITVTADPSVAVVDPIAAVVPAQTVDVPLHVEGTFAATGVQARETRASGRVRFRSENTVDEVSVASGTIVATADGIEFSTTRAATVPRADFATSTPGTVDVPVRATRAGVRGNVEAGTITVLSGSLAGQLISVRNPEPTSGGERIEGPVITQEDYDSAVAVLGSQLTDALAALLADPASVPRGLTAFPETAAIGAAQADQLPAAVVGILAPNFTLGLDAPGRVLAVNESLVDEVAAARLRSAVTGDTQIIADAVAVSRTPGHVIGQTISYDATPSAQVYSAPDSPVLIDRIKGRRVDEARAILAQYGMVEIAMWPEFIDRLPEQGARISLTIAAPISIQ